MSEQRAFTQPGAATHLLPGLQPDNLLAFLALLGLLRALDAARPEWEARVAWEGMPPRVRLSLTCDADEGQLIAAVDAGIRGLGAACISEGPLFDRPNLKYAPDEFRGLALAVRDHRERARVVAALASDGAVRGSERDPQVEPTALCAMSGQGHQCFLSRLGDMLAPAELEEQDRFDELSRALLQQWRYEDRTESFRWDPIEDRRYAYQFGNPSESANKIGTVSGANRLAAFGLAALTSAPTARGLATLGVFGSRRRQQVCWPLVAAPASLAGHIALLAHPWLGDQGRAPGLAGYGVLAVARSQRYGVAGAAGTYFNFTRAHLQYL